MWEDTTQRITPSIPPLDVVVTIRSRDVIAALRSPTHSLKQECTVAIGAKKSPPSATIRQLKNARSSCRGRRGMVTVKQPMCTAAVGAGLKSIGYGNTGACADTQENFEREECWWRCHRYACCCRDRWIAVADMWTVAVASGTERRRHQLFLERGRTWRQKLCQCRTLLPPISP